MVFQAVSPVDFYSGVVDIIEGHNVYVRPTDRRLIEDKWMIPIGSSQKCYPIPAEMLERAADSEEPAL